MKTFRYIAIISIFALACYACGQQKKSDEEQIKIMSYNIRTNLADNGTPNAWENRRGAVVDLLRSESPTIFGVQEAQPDQLEYISEQLPDYKVIGVAGDDGANNAIFFKIDAVNLDNCGVFWLSESPDEPSFGWDAAYMRTVNWAIFTMTGSGERLFYMNTHLDNVGEVAREESIRVILDKIEQLNPEGYPTVLTGDFNINTDSPIFEPLREVLSDCRVEAQESDDSDTYNAWGDEYAQEQIDHIFCSRFSTIPRFKVVTDSCDGIEYPSDHYPLYALLIF